MNLDFRRQPDDEAVWVATIDAWALTLREVPEDRLGDSYEAAIDAHQSPHLPTAIDVRNAWRRILDGESRERAMRRAERGERPRALEGLEYQVCSRCARSGFARPERGTFVCPLCRDGLAAKARLDQRGPQPAAPAPSGFRSVQDLSPIEPLEDDDEDLPF
jgi:hypothetical protein